MYIHTLVFASSPFTLLLYLPLQAAVLLPGTPWAAAATPPPIEVTAEAAVFPLAPAVGGTALAAAAAAMCGLLFTSQFAR